ncbi:ARM repeat-containing protein [Patellaria atrata CBS 101060]|uniref:ARM repeat-containing protein n=1 Tax=Patellaria atrata CBS 101060 TaxID=1346257 RepID=A0A9P4SFQ9_9PEZI|nr:ARM repeat-containing protein [Patellaria atrata CBS 101060]
MADQEEDFSSLPLPDRLAHKNWKVRKEGYEAAKKEFDRAANESDPVVRQFIQDPSLWKAAVADSNVAAQQEGLGALCSFLQVAGQAGCTRTRNLTITSIVEKGLAATRPAAKQAALEALMLYIELDRAEPVIEELLPMLSHKQPKIIAATLNALTAIYHAYGCKTVEPKPVLKVLPKVFGHADKNVRGEAQNLTVEFYRWVKDAMKPLFWNDLKPVQQQDLEKLFEKVKDEPPPKQERLLRSQQEAIDSAPPGGEAGGEDMEEEEAAFDLEPEYEAVDVFPKIPKDLQERLSSSKWKDRKEALDDLHTAINHPKIAEGPFDEIVRSLAKCMKDANIAVVSIAGNCVELLAKGLKKGFAKYRSTIIGPIIERLKEKKQAVTDALGAALDAVFAATSLGECLEDILEALKHKNPQVKLESTRFLIRCLKTTREAPQPPEVKSIADASTKLLTESQEVQRSAGAEVLGTLWKIMGDRIMAAHLEGLDDIRKAKIKEYYESAEVKAKYKPKAAAPPPKAAAAPGPKKVLGGKKPAAVKKPAPPAARAPSPPPESAAPLAPKPSSRPGVSKLAGPKSSIAGPSAGAGLQKRAPGLARPAVATSPRKLVSPVEEPPAAVPALKFGMGRGLAGRPLGKPATVAPEPLSASVPSGLSAVERAELDELRAEVERLRRTNEEMRSERQRLNSEIHELRNQNAQLIEDHTRDVLSIKAKETQLVRARSDAEAAEQTVASQQREVDRLKRELSRQVRATSPAPLDVSDQIYSELNGGAGRYDNHAAQSYVPGYGGRNLAGRSYVTSPSEGKENLPDSGRHKLSPGRPAGLSRPGSGATGRASPALAGSNEDGPLSRSASSGSAGGQGPAESWRRAAEVTQSLKARIEMMKVGSIRC